MVVSTRTARARCGPPRRRRGGRARRRSPAGARRPTGASSAGEAAPAHLEREPRAREQAVDLAAARAPGPRRRPSAAPGCAAPRRRRGPAAARCFGSRLTSESQRGASRGGSCSPGRRDVVDPRGERAVARRTDNRVVTARHVRLAGSARGSPGAASASSASIAVLECASCAGSRQGGTSISGDPSGALIAHATGSLGSRVEPGSDRSRSWTPTSGAERLRLEAAHELLEVGRLRAPS